MNKSLIVLIPIILALLGLQFSSLSSDRSSNLTANPPKTVTYVNLTRYYGLWYEQARLPIFYENNCQKTTAQYTPNKDGTIKVNNTCERNGKRGGGVTTAYVDPRDKEQTNSKLRVEWIKNLQILSGDYWIVRLDKDYQYSVVSGPTYADLWILYRQPNMPEILYRALCQDLQKDGFPVQKLKRTIQ